MVGAEPVCPCLVVIIITPLAAREPYSEAAAASFSTVTEAMSCDEIEDNFPS